MCAQLPSQLLVLCLIVSAVGCVGRDVSWVCGKCCVREPTCQGILYRPRRKGQGVSIAPAGPLQGRFCVCMLGVCQHFGLLLHQPPCQLQHAAAHTAGQPCQWQLQHMIVRQHSTACDSCECDPPDSTWFQWCCWLPAAAMVPTLLCEACCPEQWSSLVHLPSAIQVSSAEHIPLQQQVQHEAGHLYSRPLYNAACMCPRGGVWLLLFCVAEQPQLACWAGPGRHSFTWSLTCQAATRARACSLTRGRGLHTCIRQLVCLELGTRP